MKSKQKVLLLGGNGKLGSEIIRFTSTDLTFDHPTHAQLDVTNKDNLSNYINNSNPDKILYAVAVSSLDAAENNSTLAYLLNAELPRFLTKFRIPICYISTEAVFDGALHHNPFKEADTPNPISVYAKSKVAGEHAICESSNNNLVVRLSTLYSVKHNKKDFLARILGSLQKGLSAEGIIDQYTTPIYTPTAAKAIQKLLIKRATGIYHVAPVDHYSNFDFIKLLSHTYGFNHELITPITYREFMEKRTTHRAQYSQLNIDKFINNIGSDILRTVKEDLAQYKKELAFF